MSAPPVVAHRDALDKALDRPLRAIPCTTSGQGCGTLAGAMRALLCSSSLTALLLCPGPARANPGDDDAHARARNVQAVAAGVNRLLNAVATLEHLPDELTRAYEDARTEWLRLMSNEDLVRLYRGKLHWRIYGATVAESSRYLGIGGGIELAWDAPLCRFVGAGTDSQLYRDPDDAGLVTSGFATACLPVAVAALELTYRFERSVRPQLAARPVLYPGRYSADIIGMRSHNMKWRSNTFELAFAPVDFELGFLRQDVADMSVEPFYATIKVDVIRWIGLGRGFLGGHRVLGFGSVRYSARSRFEDTAPAIEANKIVLSPVAIQGARVGAMGLYLDAELGWARGKVYEVLGMNMIEELGTFDTIGADVQMYGGSSDRRVGLRYERMVEPTYDASLLLDDRVSAWLTWQEPRWTATGQAFLAQTTEMDQLAAQEPFLTGGASLEVGLTLGEHLHALVRVEGARSFYASPTPAATDAPEWTFRAMTALSSQLGSDD